MAASHLLHGSRLRRPLRGRTASGGVGGADHGPLGTYFLDAAQQELAEAACLFDTFSRAGDYGEPGRSALGEVDDQAHLRDRHHRPGLVLLLDPVRAYREPRRFDTIPSRRSAQA